MEPNRADLPSQTLTARCCIAGGGPAGMMLGLLLARAGIDTIVCEKHDDFLRDFRGDTIHPSTLEAMNDLGLLDDLLRLPHSKTRRAEVSFGKVEIPIADFSRLPVTAKFVAFMPQWDFLDFLAAQGRRRSSFRLLMGTDVEDLVEDNGRVTGVRARSKDGSFTILADLTIGADGRHSRVREAAGLVPEDRGAPMDVFWFRVSRDESDGEALFGRIDAGQILVRFNRGAYWQCAYVIPKGSAAALRTEGLEHLREKIAGLEPLLRDRLKELESFDSVKLLTVRVDRLPLWHKPGLLCIGDAAHAMSPIGGVGINLAIQDAIATANILAAPLSSNEEVTETDLAKVQKRREWPAKATQAMQIFIQNRMISQVLASNKEFTPPLVLRLFSYCPVLRRIPARLIGMGVRPERVTSPALVP
jgi:2-polyprenyl-6-methoxyphenol hydroxylase-like FAD-dependent oxidoreductase